MRMFPAALAVCLVLLCLSSWLPAASSVAQAADPAGINADPATVPDAPPIPAPKGPPPAGQDTPPAFMQRPATRAQRVRPDLTFAQRPAPKEFRGVAWGLSLEEARAAQPTLTPVLKPVPLAGTYAKTDELLKLGEADLRSVAYYFPKGKLSGAGIVFEGEANYFLIKEHLIGLYGPGRQLGDRYGWTWSEFSIELRMRGAMGELRYNHAP
jgi:hypothetical protein